MPYVRPAGSKADDAALAALFVKVIAETPELKHPLSIESITKAELAEYDAIYFSGGHGSIGDFHKSDAIAQLGRWAIELNTPIAAVCHGHCGLLALRDSEGRWPFEGYRMTCFSHAEELVTDMVGRLPFVLELEVRRLGAIYEKAENIWDSHVVEDRNLLTGQNPYSSEALADAIIKRLATATN
jgi:putative intracellular protease/amidase